MTIDARSLRYFAEIVACGSMSRAAAALGVSQPALSKCIRELEGHLRVKLLDRSASGVTPTISGRTLYVRATSVTAEISRAEAEIKALAAADAGLVSIGVLPSQTPLLTDAALRLIKTRPKLRLRVIERARSELMAGLLRGEFDLIVSVIAPDRDPPNVSSQVLFHDRPNLIMRKSHPLDRGPNLRLRLLANYPWLVPPAESDRWASLEKTIAGAGIGWPPKTIIECHASAFLKAMVVQSDCIGLLPNDAATAEEQAGLIRSIPLPNLRVTRAVGLAYRNDYPQSEAALAVARALTDAVARRTSAAAP